MTIVRPFKGVTYNLEKVLLKQVISPPLCIANIDSSDRFASKSFYNISNLLISGKNDDYSDVTMKYSQWKNEKVLIKETEPALYLYEQQFLFDGKLLTRTGFVGLIKLNGENETDYEIELDSTELNKSFELMKASKANLNQVTGLYLDNSKRLENIFADIKKNMPVLSAVDDNATKNTIWLIKDEETIHTIENFMKDRDVLIADGCSSYKTSLKYCKHMRKSNEDCKEDIKSYDFAMMNFLNLCDEGSKVFNSLRVVTIDDSFDKSNFLNKLKEKFEVIKLEDENHDLPLKMKLFGENFGLIIEDEILEKLHPIHRKIDAYVLHKVLIDEILNIGVDGIGFRLEYVNSESIDDDMDNKIIFEISKEAKEAVLDVFEHGSSNFGTLIYSYPPLQSGLLINEI